MVEQQRRGVERAKLEEVQAVSSKHFGLLRIEDASPFLFFFCFVSRGWGGAQGVRRGTQRWGSRQVVVVEKAKWGRDRVARCGVRGMEWGRPPVGWAGPGLGPHLAGLCVPSMLRQGGVGGLGPKRVRFWPGGMCDWPVTPRLLRDRHQQRHQGQQVPVETPRYTLYPITI